MSGGTSCSHRGDSSLEMQCVSTGRLIRSHGLVSFFFGLCLKLMVSFSPPVLFQSVSLESQVALGGWSFFCCCFACVLVEGEKIKREPRLMVPARDRHTLEMSHNKLLVFVRVEFEAS